MYRQDSSGEGSKFYVPRCTHHDKLNWSTHTDSCGEEGATAPLQPQVAEEIWLVTKSTHKLLQMHN